MFLLFAFTGWIVVDMKGMRTEQDRLGLVDAPSDKIWGNGNRRRRFSQEAGGSKTLRSCDPVPVKLFSVMASRLRSGGLALVSLDRVAFTVLTRSLVSANRP
jgi:hypothetical protein